MNKYGQYCPVARAAEILGDRWTMLIVRDLITGARHFNELERGLPGIPKALLSGRLRRLVKDGVVEREQVADRKMTRYQLTPAGWDLYPVIDSLTRWGAKWAFGDPEPAELNPVLLLWWMRDRVKKEKLLDRRVVIEFHFIETHPRRLWLVLQPTDVSVCVSHPGFDVDILITADLAALYQVWLGRKSFSEVEMQRRIQIDASPSLARVFPSWFSLSPVADAVREALANG